MVHVNNTKPAGNSTEQSRKCDYKVCSRIKGTSYVLDTNSLLFLEKKYQSMSVLVSVASVRALE